MALDTQMIFSTFIGAFVSGLVGLVLFFLKSRVENLEEIKKWYNRTASLAKQVEAMTPTSDQVQVDALESMGSEGSETVIQGIDEEQAHLISTYETLRRETRDHVLNSPSEIDDGIANLTRGLSEKCYIAKETLINPNQTEEGSLDSVIENARELEEEASDHENQIGWLFNPNLHTKLSR